MKAITIWQPWASLIACGAKKNETRSWYTSYRGDIAIHASKKPLKKIWDEILDEKTKVMINTITATEAPHMMYRDELIPILPCGSIVAIAELKDCIRITPEYVLNLSRQEYALGDYTTGRYAWVLDNVRPLDESIEISGKQGIWQWDGNVMK